jgi:hypothetical protein
MRESDLREIFDKTNGHCHFCGDPIEFGNRGWSEKPDEHWEKDHVIQRHKGRRPRKTACQRARATTACAGIALGTPSAICSCMA